MTDKRYEPMKCRQHPRYNGHLAPKADCLVCWKIYANDLQQRLKNVLLQKIFPDSTL